MSGRGICANLLNSLGVGGRLYHRMNEKVAYKAIEIDTRTFLLVKVFSSERLIMLMCPPPPLLLRNPDYATDASNFEMEARWPRRLFSMVLTKNKEPHHNFRGERIFLGGREKDQAFYLSEFRL